MAHNIYHESAEIRERLCLHKNEKPAAWRVSGWLEKALVVGKPLAHTHRD